MNIQKIKPSSQCVPINEINLPSGIIYKHKKLLNEANYWHKFIVTNTSNVSRNELLQAILDHVHPEDLIPVFYSKDHLTSNSYFMARNCGPAIEKLCKDNLTVENPYNKNNTAFNKPFKIAILLNFSTTSEVKVDVQKNVVSVLQNRFNSDLKTLNLRNFSSDAELTEFCPLSQPKIMYFVLHLAKSLHPKALILAENNIKTVTPLEVLAGEKIYHIDLRDNKIASVDDLTALKNIKTVKEIFLTGNPLCTSVDEHKYVTKIIDICPKISVLDGVIIKQFGFPVVKRNFLCDTSSFDLVNQFVEYYFTVYDSRTRLKLEQLYHDNAMFSLTTTYHQGQASSTSAFLKLYHSFSRNLHKSADMSRNYEYLFRGKLKIVQLLEKFPHSEHDPYSFNIDLIYKQPTSAIIVVNGVFKEPPQSLLAKEQFYGFTRMFVLEISNGRECVIVNEQLHIYNALTHQQLSSFQVTKPIKLQKPLAVKPKDRQEAVRTIKAITNLKLEWARKCLEECNYDLKMALDLFIDLYKNDKFPQEAFIDDNDEREFFGRFMCDAEGNLIAEEPTELIIRWNIPCTELQLHDLNTSDQLTNNMKIFKTKRFPKIPKEFKSMIKSHILSNEKKPVSFLF